MRGYVLKKQAAADLLQAIKEVQAGSVYVSPGMSRALVEAVRTNTEMRTDVLTGREREVLQLVAEGKTSKEIAAVLSENADLKILIVGHTDSDGDEAANLDLSKRRAASVKTALANEFKVDVSRMDVDGKGESQPIDRNDTPAGKANNRRVEFVKK